MQYIQRPKISSIPFEGRYEVSDAAAILGIWDHDSGNHRGPYSRPFINTPTPYADLHLGSHATQRWLPGKAVGKANATAASDVPSGEARAPGSEHMTQQRYQT